MSSQYCQSLELAGVAPPLFEDDSGPEVATLDDLRDSAEDTGVSNPFGSSKGTSLGRAEVLIGCLLDAATDLAYQVNDYKKAEIRARIAELEAADLSDPDVKRDTLARIVELNRMLDDLDKQVRWLLDVWKVETKP